MLTHKHPTIPPLPQSRRSLRVLIVEDEPRLRELLLDVITDMGFNTVAAKSAEDALRMLETETADIAILDLQLPLMGGIELFQIVHNRWPGMAVIILTGFGDLNAAREAIRLNVVDFLSKPFHLSDIEIALDRASKRTITEGSAQTARLTPNSDTPLTLHENEKRLILAALTRHGGNRTAAAAELGISRRKLHYWLSENIEVDD